eukprot:scaffold37156_cov43-Cyclotella_meneghiniana.AAC.3
MMYHNEISEAEDLGATNAISVKVSGDFKLELANHHIRRALYSTVVHTIMSSLELPEDQFNL